MTPQTDDFDHVMATERRAILFTVIGNLGMAALGFGFAIATNSQAVLLDAGYSLIGFALGLVSLRVSALVMEPDNERYPFGYVAYEPILNLAKGLMIGTVALLALAASVESLLTGGREIATDVALVYALLAAAGCFVLAEFLRRRLRTLTSPLVEIDRQNWLIDGIVSLGVGAGFLVGVVLIQLDMTMAARYVDPGITALLCLFMLPIPARILRDNWHQLVARAPNDKLLREVEALIDEALPPGFAIQRELRLLETGRLLSVHLYVQVDDQSVADCDAVREALWQHLSANFTHLALDVAFTTDPKWFRHASGDLDQ
jgi:cation diffusion facilitator family transporter